MDTGPHELLACRYRCLGRVRRDDALCVGGYGNLKPGVEASEVSENRPRLFLKDNIPADDKRSNKAVNVNKYGTTSRAL